MNTVSLSRNVANQPPAPSRGQSRREFLATAVRAAGAVSVPTIVAAKALGLEARAAAASERLTLGVIGFGPRCQYVLGEMLKFKDRTVNGTFARVASARNSRTVAFGYVFTPSRGLTRLVHGRRR